MFLSLRFPKFIFPRVFLAHAISTSYRNPCHIELTRLSFAGLTFDLRLFPTFFFFFLCFNFIKRQNCPHPYQTTFFNPICFFHTHYISTFPCLSSCKLILPIISFTSLDNPHDHELFDFDFWYKFTRIYS